MFLVSISRPKIYGTISVIFEISIAIYAMGHVGIDYSLINIILFILMFLLSLILYYFLRWFTIMPAFWFIRMWSLRDLMGKLNQFMRYPAGIFPNFLKYALFVFFPILTVSYIPARTLFYQPKIEFIIYMLLITILFGLITKLLWRAGLKHYGSASS
jgi:ABC-2 type transport system permease protein